MTYKEIGDNNQLGLDNFKRYARITTTEDDEQIRSFIRSATMEVQEIADRALLPCTIVMDGEGRELQLWQPIIATLDSVVDTETGDEMKAECTVFGQTLSMPYDGKWRIQYTTEPNAHDVERLRPYVWKIVAALYDGNTDEEARIKASIPSSYVVQ